jgi:hypothetical protein
MRVSALSDIMALYEAVILRHCNFACVKCSITAFQIHIPLFDYSWLLHVNCETFSQYSLWLCHSHQEILSSLAFTVFRKLQHFEPRPYMNNLWRMSSGLYRTRLTSLPASPSLSIVPLLITLSVHWWLWSVLSYTKRGNQLKPWRWSSYIYIWSRNKLINLSALTKPPWSSGQSSWKNIQRSRVWFPALPVYLRSSGSGTGSNKPREDNWIQTWKRK